VFINFFYLWGEQYLSESEGEEKSATIEKFHNRCTGLKYYFGVKNKSWKLTMGCDLLPSFERYNAQRGWDHFEQEIIYGFLITRFITLLGTGCLGVE
jgi:hypothetical protein